MTREVHKVSRAVSIVYSPGDEFFDIVGYDGNDEEVEMRVYAKTPRAASSCVNKVVTAIRAAVAHD